MEKEPLRVGDVGIQTHKTFRSPDHSPTLITTTLSDILRRKFQACGTVYRIQIRSALTEQ